MTYDILICFYYFLLQVENSHARDDDFLSDVCDTDYFKDHPLFGVDPYALQLLLYFDELEVCNPLGSRANKHKLGMILSCAVSVFSVIFILL